MKTYLLSGLFLALILFLIFGFLSPKKASAQGSPDDSARCIPSGFSEDVGIDTAIGCIPTLTDNPADFLGAILGWAVGIGSGIAFLLIVYAGFMIMTASGDPARLKAGQELLTAALSGLIMLIFSVFILKVIGVDILKLPGF